MSALAGFVRHAELGRGVEGVYEAAQPKLSDRDLGRLAARLRRVDSTWKLPKAERHRLALALVETGLPDRRVCDQAGISRTTLWRLREKVAEQRNRPSETALQSGVSVSKSPPPTPRSSLPLLHYDATSGASPQVGTGGG
ncbi:MAG: helix-turn-helix domain-containing protein [Actinomycetota bacterium]|nr:helix-turn-helix domain-containing protein [Actinomycetota bacterium]